MTTSQFKSYLQSEIKAVGIDNPIKSVFDDAQYHTTIQFAYILNMTSPLYLFLQNRFMYGVTQINDYTIYLNTPQIELKSLSV